ncbi:MAG: MogA/MoaB family molybdenum cofactor biosynthesis protein [Planctomycetales bacterium]|nr:MogA/MoaB family molybdenum cofactor biosynthesis protein [Planctomycetales bacterium]
MPDTPVSQHKAAAPDRVRCAVLTISDTRTLADDRGGALVVELLESHGHSVVQRRIVPDERDQIAATVEWLAGREDVQAILLTGGTGVSPRDNTVDAVERLLTKRLPGYGELFRVLSYQEIGAAAMLSRACGGVIGQQVVLVMPGSPNAVRLAMEKLILPELGHLVAEAAKQADR